ncbi:hypothetical protein FH965_03500 [Streptomyces spectabilis]|uniref:Uncharacterized protein n=1 Tax=Streptomyces spectabilis TaxID=68270 RepID=A0A516R247_STRST|nr:hypothetical protein FH965_03500 [Streptomyces spectabilis]
MVYQRPLAYLLGLGGIALLRSFTGEAGETGSTGRPGGRGGRPSRVARPGVRRRPGPWRLGGLAPDAAHPATPATLLPAGPSDAP